MKVTIATYRRIAGLTVVEVLVALAVLGIVTAAITTTYISSIRHNSDAGMRTQSAQLLNGIGRRVAGSEGFVLPQAGTPIVLDYGEVGDMFSDLEGDGFADPDRHRLTITNLGAVTLGSAQVTHYQIEVCVRAQGSAAERCMVGNTAGPAPNPPGDPPAPLPGIN